MELQVEKGIPCCFKYSLTRVLLHFTENVLRASITSLMDITCLVREGDEGEGEGRRGGRREGR
jgi:hypothetical protein